MSTFYLKAPWPAAVTMLKRAIGAAYWARIEVQGRTVLKRSLTSEGAHLPTEHIPHLLSFKWWRRDLTPASKAQDWTWLRMRTGQVVKLVSTTMTWQASLESRLKISTMIPNCRTIAHSLESAYAAKHLLWIMHLLLIACLVAQTSTEPCCWWNKNFIVFILPFIIRFIDEVFIILISHWKNQQEWLIFAYDQIDCLLCILVVTIDLLYTRLYD